MDKKAKDVDIVRKIKEEELFKKKLKNPIKDSKKFFQSLLEIQQEFSRKK